MSRLAWYRLFLAAGFVAALGLASTVASQRTAASMAGAAESFLATLTPEQRGMAALPFDSDDRERFHYIPTEMFPRQGLKIEDMDETQRRAAHALLEKGLSEVGYQVAVDVMELEGILAALEQGGRLDRNPEWYYFSVFGAPGPAGAWGWRVEGHHLSLHYTIVDGQITVSTPTFLGANPATVPSGPRRGLRAMKEQEDTARALLASLNEDQRAIAVFDDVAPTNIVTGAELVVDPLEPIGVPGAALTGGQRDLLMAVIESYVGLMADDVAALRRAAVLAGGLDDVRFAWAGPAERGEVAYYRVQGPEFLIEFDNTQEDPNHIHAAYRDFDGDLGRDLLREHVARAH